MAKYLTPLPSGANGVNMTFHDESSESLIRVLNKDDASVSFTFSSNLDKQPLRGRQRLSALPF